MPKQPPSQSNSLPGDVNATQYSISAYRVLYILLVLIQYRSLNMIELNRFLFENPDIQRIYNTETLTKYINTLREVGCHIPRANSKTDYSYDLVKHPFPLTLNQDEAGLLERLLGLLSQSPDESLHWEYKQFLSWFNWCLAEPVTQACFLSSAETQAGCGMTAVQGVQRKTLQKFKKYCQEAFTLELLYRNPMANLDDSQDQDAQPVRRIQLEPYDVLERGSRMFLHGRDVHTHEPMMLDLSLIDSVERLPRKNKYSVPMTTVLFALTGSLAKSYRLYPNEKIVYQVTGVPDNEIHVKTRCQDPDLLLNRLLKYGERCEILSPSTLRHEARRRIETLLSSLGEEMGANVKPDAALPNVPEPNSARRPASIQH